MTDDKKVVLETGGAFGGRIPVKFTKKLKHKNDHFPSGHLSIVIVGKSGSGKSFLVRELIPNIACQSQVIALTKIVNNPVYVMMRRWCNSTPIEYDSTIRDDKQKEDESAPAPAPSASASASGVPSIPPLMTLDQLSKHGTRVTASTPSSGMIRFEEAHDPVEAEALLNMMIADKPPNTWGTIIVDDFGEGSITRTGAYTKVHNMIAMMLRNYHYNVISISQSPTSIPTLVRNNCNMFFVFNMADVHSIRAARLMFMQTGRSGEEFDSLFDYVRKCEHGYMLVIIEDKKTRVLLNLPGDTNGLAEVDSGRGLTEEEVRDDTTLQGIIQDILDLDPESGMEKNSVAKLKISRLKAELARYIAFKADQVHMPIPDLEALVSKVYQI